MTVIVILAVLIIIDIVIGCYCAVTFSKGLDMLGIGIQSLKEAVSQPPAPVPEAPKPKEPDTSNQILQEIQQIKRRQEHKDMRRRALNDSHKRRLSEFKKQWWAAKKKAADEKQGG